MMDISCNSLGAISFRMLIIFHLRDVQKWADMLEDIKSLLHHLSNQFY